MQRLKLLGLALIALVALSAIGASSALALENPELLPNPTAAAPAVFSIKSGAGELQSSLANIKCKADTAKATFTSAREGTTTIDFTGCTVGGEECHSLGDSSGTILVNNAKITLVDVLLGGTTLGLGLLVQLTNEVHIECKGIVGLVLVKNAVIGEFLSVANEEEIKVKTIKKLDFKLLEGKQEYRTCDLPAVPCENSKKVFELKVKTILGEESGGEVSEEEVELEKGGPYKLMF